MNNDSLEKIDKISNPQSIFMIQCTSKCLENLIYGLNFIISLKKTFKDFGLFCVNSIFIKASNENLFKVADLCQSILETTENDFQQLN